jgi:hypothetical protein
MPLIEFKTSLKSLKFGKDRPYGGSSNQPYIQSSIPEGDIPTSGGPDFILRGGILAPVRAAKDVSRLTQMFFDLKSPNGFQFIAKQNILSRTSVQTEASTGAGYGGNFVNQGVYLPSSTLAQAGVGFTGTHLNLFGIDPSSPMAGITQTSLSSLFFNKSDSKPILTLGLNRYEDIVKEANKIENNRDETISVTPNPSPLSRQSSPFLNRNNNFVPSLSTNNSPFSSTSNFSFSTPNIKSPGPFNEIKVIPANFSNRLLRLWDEKEQKESIELLSYPGGPGSILGVGKTIIPFADQRTGINNPKLKNSGFFSSEEFGYYNYSVFKNQNTVNLQGSRIFNGNNVSTRYEDRTGINLLESFKTNNETGDIQKFITSVYQSGNFKSTERSTENGSLTFTQDQLIKQSSRGPIQDFRKVLISGSKSVSNVGDAAKQIKDENYSSILSISPDYFSQNIEKRLNLGDPGSKQNIGEDTINILNYTAASGNGVDKDYKLALDKITAGAIYNADKATHGKYLSLNNTEHAGNDLVKFSIGVIQNELIKGEDGKSTVQSNYMHFRAFIDSFSDSYTSDWNSYNYVGRGDKFYNYTGFERTVNLSFTVYAQSKAELIPMYKKLNYLASSLAPDYSKFGFMKGNLHKMTIGGYLFEQVGIIKSLTYDIPEETSWEIGINNEQEVKDDTSVKELPHMIKVTNLSFIPIQHFLPRVAKPLTKDDKQSKTRYIALAANTSDDETNYTKDRT